MAFTKPRTRFLTIVATVALLFSGLAFSFFAFSAHVAHASGGGNFNQPGNLLISDQFNNRAIEVDRSTKNIVWSFGSGNPALCNPGPGTIIGLNDAERVSGGLTILSGTGIPAGADPLLLAGCVDNRVIVVDQNGKIVWQYGQAGVTGDGPNELNVPVFAIQLPNHNILIVDQSNERVIEVDKNTKKIVFSYGCLTCNLLNNPNSVELLPNGHFLIADENNNRVIEITPKGRIVFQYSLGLKFAAFASRLPNGDTLITDLAMPASWRSIRPGKSCSSTSPIRKREVILLPCRRTRCAWRMAIRVLPTSSIIACSSWARTTISTSSMAC